MQYTGTYHSPIGGMFLAADTVGLTGLWFDGAKYFPHNLDLEYTGKELPVFVQTKRWLDMYFSGKEPTFMPPIHMIGSAFQLEIWSLLQQIPYGKTTTYRDIAKEIAKKKGMSQMAAQAVGGAVGRNKISIIIPCHRVVGTNGSLTGYAGGIDKKEQLLSLEKVDMSRFFVPKKGTAL